jgi:hypothetical protein
MTDDFQLFGDPDDGEGPIDPDVALVCAYLARELSPMQVLVLEERLATDAEFRAAMQPLIDAWAAPVASLEGGRGRTTTELSAVEKAKSWQRFQQEQPTAVSITPVTQRKRSMTRIAAVIALIVVPMVTFAQVVSYVAKHPSAPGHALVQKIAAPLVRAAPPDGDRPTGVELGIGTESGAPPEQPRQARQLGLVVATAQVRPAQLVALSDGRVLVSDARGHQLLLFDSTLASSRVVYDSVTMLTPGRRGSSLTFARTANYLLPFRADSSLWWSDAAQMFTVLDPAGKAARTLTVPPRGTNGFQLIDVASGIVSWPTIPASSARHGLIYGVSAAQRVIARKAADARNDSAATANDSTIVVRVNLDTRAVDTVGTLSGLPTDRPGLRLHPPDFDALVAPFRFVDDLTTTADGSIVMLHAREYRLDWVTPDGARSSQMLPYAWRRVTEETRKSVLDSIGKLPAWSLGFTKAKPIRVAVDSGAAGFHRKVVTVGQRLVKPMNGAAPVFEVPEFYAPVPPNALRADGDGNVWIQQILPVADPAYTVWDVVNRTRGVIDRVRIPTTRTIVGFGRGVVYLSSNEAGTARLEKVRIR